MSRFFAAIFALTLLVGCAPAEDKAPPATDPAPATDGAAEEMPADTSVDEPAADTTE